MTMDALNLEIEVLSAEEAASIWKRQTKRPPNFAQYLAFLNSRGVGDSFRVKVPAGDKNEENAKEIRRNFAEAAKERTQFVVVTDATLPNGVDVDTQANVNGETATFGSDGKWHVERKAPVVLRWKVQAHKETREVVSDKGKKGSVEVSVIDALEALIVSSEAVQKRAPRAAKEVVAVNNPPADAKKGAKIQLADGRTATLGANGKWTAPKQEASANGVANGVAGTADTSAEAPAVGAAA